MGTMLYARGIFINRSYDELNLSQPETVAGVHAEYLQAGAEIIETNTFGANSCRLERYGLRDKVREINLAGVRIARQCVAQIAEKQALEAFVAGAIGPLGIPLAAAGRAHARPGARSLCRTDCRAGRGRARRGRGPADRSKP